MASRMRVRTVGLREFTRRTKAADRTLEQDITAMLQRFAVLTQFGTVAEREAQYVTPRPQRTGKLSGGLIQRTIGRRVSLEDTAKHAGWWEFGGWTRSPRGDTRREIVRGGRALFPVIERERARLVRWAEALGARVVGKVG